MTAKPTFPPTETAAGRDIPGPKTTLRPGMIVIKKSGDTEFIGLVIDITENGDGNRRLLVESLAPGARKIIHPPSPPTDHADPEFMPAWAHKALIAVIAIGAAFCAVMVWQSLAAVNAALAPV